MIKYYKMKKCISTIIFLIVTLCELYAQNITVRFTGRSQDNAKTTQADSMENPAGWKTLNGQFAYINENGTWWSSSAYGSHHWDRYIHFTRTYVTRSHNENHIGMSIRCIQD